MPRNKKSSNVQPSAPRSPQPQVLDFEGDGFEGTIVWSPLGEDESNAMAADIERLLVDRVLAALREP